MDLFDVVQLYLWRSGTDWYTGSCGWSHLADPKDTSKEISASVPLPSSLPPSFLLRCINFAWPERHKISEARPRSKEALLNWKTKHVLRLSTVKKLPFWETLVLFPIHLYCIVRVLLHCQVSLLSRRASSAWLGDDKGVKSSQLWVWRMWVTLFVSIWHLNGFSELMVSTAECIRIFKFSSDKSTVGVLSHASINGIEPF